jgi:hypothetical protein
VKVRNTLIEYMTTQQADIAAGVEQDRLGRESHREHAVLGDEPFGQVS